MAITAAVPDAPIVARERTPQSRAFEAAWRMVRGDALVPDHKTLPLRHFKSMLSDMLLVEFFPDEPARSNIRIVGEGIRARIQRDIAGQSHFDFIPEARRLEAAQTMRTVVTHPCGLWEVTAAHYKRGYAHCHEITAFPLWHAGCAPMLLAMIVPCPGQIIQIPKDIAVIALEGPRESLFLDVGTGTPLNGEAHSLNRVPNSAIDKIRTNALSNR